MSKKPYDQDLKYKDDPAVRETFAEGIHQITVDQTTFRLILTVSRAELPKGDKATLHGYKTTAARIGCLRPRWRSYTTSSTR